MICLIFSGSGADGQRAGQRDGQTGHTGRDGESEETDDEVLTLTHTHTHRHTYIVFNTWFLCCSCHSNQTAWRKANLACKLAMDNVEKDELLCGGENHTVRHRSALVLLESTKLLLFSRLYLFHRL